MKYKKAYFFLMDGLIAVIILFVGFILISATNPNKPVLIHNKHLSQDLINIFSNTKINELCEDCDCPSYTVLNELCPYINNKDNTMLEVIGELYTRKIEDEDIHGKKGNEWARDLIEELIYQNKLFYKDLYGFAFIIEDEVIYNSMGNNMHNFPVGTYDLNNEEDVQEFNSDIDRNKIKILLSTKKVIMGYWENENTGDIKFWGPYTVEIWTWQRK
ncbi:hypothetical protein JXB41_08780 [Candidatus Woesearchaeota archaeon]|nr:hypothetical protein [Candidatus Woesearchaeota archaeon]